MKNDNLETLNLTYGDLIRGVHGLEDTRNWMLSLVVMEALAATVDPTVRTAWLDRVRDVEVQLTRLRLQAAEVYMNREHNAVARKREQQAKRESELTDELQKLRAELKGLAANTDNVADISPTTRREAKMMRYFDYTPRGPLTEREIQILRLREKTIAFPVEYNPIAESTDILAAMEKEKERYDKSREDA